MWPKCDSDQTKVNLGDEADKKEESSNNKIMQMEQKYARFIWDIFSASLNSRNVALSLCALMGNGSLAWWFGSSCSYRRMWVSFLDVVFVLIIQTGTNFSWRVWVQGSASPCKIPHHLTVKVTKSRGIQSPEADWTVGFWGVSDTRMKMKVLFYHLVNLTPWGKISRNYLTVLIQIPIWLKFYFSLSKDLVHF